MTEVVAAWIEWDSRYNRVRRALLQTESEKVLIQKFEQKRDGEWQPYPEGSEDRWSRVHAEFTHNDQTQLDEVEADE